MGFTLKGPSIKIICTIYLILYNYATIFIDEDEVF